METTIQKYNPKRLYIAGKVTGEDYDFCFRKFKAAEELMDSVGFIVFNPMKFIPKDADWKSAMQVCIATLMQMDVVYALKDWHYSKGAKLELKIAEAFNIEIIYQ